MRNTIYELSSKHSQIVATARSPFLIDISRKPRQILNSYSFDEDHSIVLGFSVTKKFKELQNDDKDYIKVLLKVDDNIAKVFFTKKLLLSREIRKKLFLRRLLINCQKIHKTRFVVIMKLLMLEERLQL